MDVLKLSPCYPAFLITAEVPEIYMHQFWNTIKKIKDTDAYQFKLDKQKFRIDTKYFVRSSRSVPDSLTKILLNLPPMKKWFHLLRILGTLASASLGSPQTLVLEEEPAKKHKWAKHPELAKKSAPKKDVSSKKPSRKWSTGVQIRNNLGVSVSKKKAPTITNISKGIDLLFEAALLEDAQIKKVPDELQDKTTGTNKGTGTIPGIPNVPKDQFESENKSWGESRDDNDSNDDDVIDDDGNEDDSNDDGEEEYEDEYVHTPSSYKSTDDENEHVDEEEYDRIDEELYKDVNVKLKDVEHGEEGKGDAEMTDAGHDDVTQDTTYDQVENDAHVTLTTVHDTQKTEVPLQSSSVSSDFAT
ncbi:hypothetical protein Tco_0046916 [Tanacetum coccineum]